MPALTTTTLDAVVSTKIQWLWEPYIAKGKVTILDGDPGLGKSMVALDLAARLSRGGPMPGSTTTFAPGRSLVFNREDNAADTIRPRAEAAGADLKYLLLPNEHIYLSDFKTTTIQLAAIAAQQSIDFLVFDPLAAYVAAIPGMTLEESSRGIINLLTAVASRTNLSVLLVRHLRKRAGGRAVHRGLGSIGVIGAARGGLLVTPRPGRPNERLISITKSNLADPSMAIGYRVVADSQGRPRIEWTEPTIAAADDLVQAKPSLPRDNAAVWLRAALAEGPRTTFDIYARAAEAGISDTTLRRARIDAGIETHKLSAKGKTTWWWYDPTAAWPAKAPFKKPREFVNTLAPLPEIGEVD